MACKALDGQVAVPADKELEGLLDQFVCVRVVQMHGLDIQRFAFDGSLTWAVFLVNADGTIYVRYGSRSGLGDLSQREISLAGFKKSLQGGLALHARYGEDKLAVGKQLAGKTQSRQAPWPVPEAIPTLKSKPRFNRPFFGVQVKGQHGGCIHCHMVPTNKLKSLRLTKQEIHDREFFPYPMPDELGFRMDPQEMATVVHVRTDSVAGRAGFQNGDRILRIDGQPIISTADIQWLLHNADNQDVLAVDIGRGDKTETLKLELKAGWRRLVGDWRRINKRLLRQILGFNVDRIPAKRARRIGLGDKLALRVDGTTRDVRKETGLGHRDLIVAIDGSREPMSVGDFTAYVLQKAKGEKIKVTIMELTDRLPRPEHEVEVTAK